MRGPSLRWLKAVAKLPVTDGTWRYSRALRSDDPVRGWKLHVSATIFSASAVFARAAKVLKTADALFKIPARFDVLVTLNAGLERYSQVGKFITVYPGTDAEAVSLAHALHRATYGLPGPRVPYDKVFRRGSLVHYRYGSFRSPGKIRPGGAVPQGIVDPFRKQAGAARKSRGAFGTEYLPFEAKVLRGKGGVYDALDLTVSPPRRVIIKEGKRHGDPGLDGIDGAARLRHEGSVLRRLRRAGAAVPEILREFSRNGNRYLVLERVEGRPLIPEGRDQPARRSWKIADKILHLLLAELALIHTAGWAWRDGKPSHILVHHGRLRLIDFEGACRLGERNPLGWGSRNYVPTDWTGRGRPFGIRQDLYAAGVIAYQLATAAFPPRAVRTRGQMLDDVGCPNVLRAQIENLLRG